MAVHLAHLPSSPRRLQAPLTVALALAAGLLAHHRPAQAEARHDVRGERLAGLTARDLTVLEPLSTEGPVALVEFADSDTDRLPAINIVARVAAHPDVVADVIAKPEHYPSFMGTLDKVKVLKRDARATVYDWKWSVAVLTLKGRNAMRLYRSTDPNSKRGHRITIDSQSGDFGTGRMSIRILPRPSGSLVVLSLRLDLRRANYIARQAAKAARSVNRSANMALGYAMLLNFKRRAEGIQGPQAKPAPAPGTIEAALRAPRIDRKRLTPFLMRGDLVISRVSGDHLLQTSVVGLVGFPRSLVREVMLDAESFGSSLVPGSKAKVVDRNADRTVFDWDINIPVVGVSGRMAMRTEDSQISVRAIGGALSGGRWHFRTEPVGQWTMVSSWADFDLRDSNWVLRRIVGADRYLGHGMNAASEVMLLRALRSRARKRGLADASKGVPARASGGVAPAQNALNGRDAL